MSKLSSIVLKKNDKSIYDNIINNDVDNTIKIIKSSYEITNTKIYPMYCAFMCCLGYM